MLSEDYSTEAEAEAEHDYGFDPQIDYYQALNEARRQHGKREAARPLDAFRFKLQKPICKDDSRRGAKGKKRVGSSRWWRNALLFWKRRGGGDRGGSQAVQHRATAVPVPAPATCSPAYPCYYGYPYQGAASPLYMADSGDAEGWMPCRRSGGGGEGTCLGSLRLTGSGEVKMPYLCLRDLAAMDASPSPSSAAAYPSPGMPIYLVT
ncbi:hypothetical protein Taro_013226 [Colocasia esculenta]|uniref:Uncharacterized protein n=1 Tax=Colocasia esculenta TaxID=4460 RepID=A0A843UF05_COLES|nr:hypothetical protein [Colocasia esculenta]